MNHVELFRQAEKALRVADEQIAVRIQAAVKLFDKPLLFGFIEIDHHVAAEDHVVALRQVLGLQDCENRIAPDS